MIHLVLRSPNGDGTYSDALGMTTDNVPHTINGVVCLPGIIGSDSVSQMESQIDISQARGNVSQGVSWSFDILDWTGSARRSVGILDGGTRFVGWRVAMYLDDAGSSTTLDAVGGSADAFQIHDVEANGTRVTLSVVSAWTLRGDTVGLASGESVVGLVAGPHEVSVPTQALPEPVALEYDASNALKEGSPNAPIQANELRAAATGKDAYNSISYFLFACSSSTEASRLFNSILDAVGNGGAFITGSKYSEPVAGMVFINSGATLCVSVSQVFYDAEDAGDVMIRSATVGAAIAGGVSSIVGFYSDGRTVLPVGSSSVNSDFVLSYTPTHLLANGFAAFTVIPSHIAYDPAGVVPPNASEVEYYNVTSDIWTDGRAPGPYVIPARPNTSSHYSAWVTTNVANQDPGGLTMPFRIIPDEIDLSGFTGFVVDVAGKFSIKNVNAEASVYFTLHEPFSSAATISKEVDGQDGTNEYIATYGPYSLGLWPQSRRFSSVDAANATGTLSANRGAYSLNAYLQYEIQGITLYGESTLSFGSNYAQVQPGASPWWASPLNSPQTAAALLDVVAPTATPNIPASALGGPLILSGFGQYIAPDDTFISSAVKLCEEFWTILCPDGADGANGAGAGEKPVAPTFALGAVEDIVTEPVIEYAPVAGSYTGRAYIAHVDEEFDAENASRFYGGWGKGADDSEFPGGDYGYMIWRTCREAYKVHGIRRAATYQFDGVHFAGNVGGYWFEAMRNGARRIEWLAYQPRFVTFKIRENAPPTWWAGNAVTIPTTMAGFAGYDFSAFSTDPVIVTSKRFDPVTMGTEYEVALPPVVPE